MAPVDTSSAATLDQAPAEAPARHPGQGARRKVRRKVRRTRSDWLVVVIAVVGAIVIAAPLLLILVNSFKSQADYASKGPLQLPIHPYLSLIHISEPTRLGMISYAVFCLKKK